MMSKQRNQTLRSQITRLEIQLFQDGETSMCLLWLIVVWKFNVTNNPLVFLQA